MKKTEKTVPVHISHAVKGVCAANVLPIIEKTEKFQDVFSHLSLKKPMIGQLGILSMPGTKESLNTRARGV